MRQSRSLRFFSALLGLWSVLLTGDPTWLHSCPTATSVSGAEAALQPSGATAAAVHADSDGHATHAAHAAHADADADGHAAHAAHTAHVQHAAPKDHSPVNANTDHASNEHDQHSQHGCDCVGVCACVACPTGPSALIVRVATVALHAETVVHAPSVVALPQQPRLHSRLPWPTAPPQLA